MNLRRKALLINPSSTLGVRNFEESTYSRSWPPLSLLNCASLLRENGYPVYLLDLETHPISDNKIVKIAKDFDFVFITSTSLDRWQCPNLNITNFLKLTKKLSRINENVYILGFHGTVDPEFILRKTEAKGIIKGEPEEIVLDLLKSDDSKSVLGISFFDLQKGKIIHNSNRPFLDLKCLPLPAFDLLDLSFYRYDLMGERFVLLETSRGCPFHCRFCVKDVMYGKGVRNKDFDKVAQEIDYVISELEAKNIYFFDLEFSNNLEMVSRICDYLIKKQYCVNWCCQMRVEKLNLLLLKKMKRSGCSLIHVGAESGSEKILAKTGKGVTRESLMEGLQMIRQSGIRSLGFFILGFPFEKKEEMLATVEFAKKLNPTYVSFHIYNPYPGLEDGFLDFKENGSLFGSGHPSYCGRILSLWTKYATASFYLRPRKILELLLNDRKRLKRGIIIFINKMRQ